MDPPGDLGAVGALRVQFADDLIERRAEHERARCGVGEDERQLVGDEAPVEGDDHPADLGCAEEGFDELWAVHQQCGDPVAGLEAAAHERIAHLVASSIKLDIGLSSPTGDVDDGFGLGVEKGALGNPLPDVVVHVGMVDRGPWMMSCTLM